MMMVVMAVDVNVLVVTLFLGRTGTLSYTVRGRVKRPDVTISDRVGSWGRATCLLGVRTSLLGFVTCILGPLPVYFGLI